MKIFRSPKRIIVFALLAVILGYAFNFVFNPFGLGPEPQKVLPDLFFTEPAKDLSYLELIVDGREAVDKIRQELINAQKSVFIQIYIWKDDNIGRRLANNLKSLAKKGVKVTVRKDMLGTFFELSDMIKGKPSPVFASDGVKGHENIDVQTDITADTDHSKYFIVDDKVTAFGGMNVADEYHLDWHDYMVIIRDSKWTEAFKQKVLNSQQWPQPSPFVITVNDRKASEIRTAFVQMIDNAKERIVIEHAYFSDDKIIEALERAAGRGVHIDLILPEEADTHHYANMITINQLLSFEPRGNIRVFLYPTMSHAKVALVDGVIASVGSANLTSRSMLRSKEVTLFVHGLPDAPMIKRLRDQLETDITESKQFVGQFQLGFIEHAGAIAGKYIW
jgi:cardiolipin synthase